MVATFCPSIEYTLIFNFEGLLNWNVMFVEGLNDSDIVEKD